MKHGKAKWGFLVVGAVAALALGAIGVAAAAGSDSSATPTPGASAQAGQGCLDDDGRGAPHGDMLRHGGPGDLAEALATLSGKDESTIMEQRAAGKSFAEIAEAYGVSEDALIAEATRIETAELDTAVEAGQITAEQRTEYLAGLQERLETAIASTDAFLGGGPGGHGPRGDCDGDDATDADGSTGAGASASPTAQTSYLTY
jgi:hypothetical protein